MRMYIGKYIKIERDSMTLTSHLHIVQGTNEWSHTFPHTYTYMLPLGKTSPFLFES